VPGARSAVLGDGASIPAYVVRGGGAQGAAGVPERIELSIAALTPDEKQIILAGCLINHNRGRGSAR